MKSIQAQNEINTFFINSLFGTDNKLKEKKVIDEDTILVLDPDTGDVVESFGKGLFYVPHGITVDNQGNIYVTDVGLHQVKRVRQDFLRISEHLLI